MFAFTLDMLNKIHRPNLATWHGYAYEGDNKICLYSYGLKIVLE